jgi:MoaA/NifB/PqqE/SkfB family radical SAM enzyme
MSQAVFNKCLEIAGSREEYVTLGGGEPTLHPKFLEWVMQAALATIEASESFCGPAVLVVTNGKKTDVAQKLAKLSKLGMVSAELSQDRFHDPIDKRTVEMFKKYADIRDVTNNGRNDLIGVGRAASDENIPVRDGCACSTLFVDPKGDFYQCGCKTKKLGNILTDEIPDSYWENSEKCQSEINKENLVIA